MKDIRINKIKTNKNPEKKQEIEFYEEKTESVMKKNSNIFSVFLFGLMSVSVVSYVFMISSSIFYAIERSQYEFKTKDISMITKDVYITDQLNRRTSSDKISYINTDSETSISLK